MSKSIIEVVPKNWARETPRNGAQSYAPAIPSGDFRFELFHTPTKIIFEIHLRKYVLRNATENRYVPTTQQSMVAHINIFGAVTADT